MKLAHGRVELELHTLRDSEGSPLLLLHSLGSGAFEWTQDSSKPWEPWPGPVYALDFAGHGDSGRLTGGGYTPEFFLADADIALEAIGGRAVVVGCGIGAYAALLLAGSRPAEVPAALLWPGRGLDGGGAEPDWSRAETSDEWLAHRRDRATDYAPGTDEHVFQCERDLRPVDYAESFAARAHVLYFSGALDEDAAPPWWIAAQRAAPGHGSSAEMTSAIEALAEFAADGAR